MKYTIKSMEELCKISGKNSVIVLNTGKDFIYGRAVVLSPRSCGHKALRPKGLGDKTSRVVSLKVSVKR